MVSRVVGGCLALDLEPRFQHVQRTHKGSSQGACQASGQKVDDLHGVSRVQGLGPTALLSTAVFGVDMDQRCCLLFERCNTIDLASFYVFSTHVLRGAQSQLLIAAQRLHQR